MGDMDGFRVYTNGTWRNDMAQGRHFVLEELTFECVQGKICRLDNL